MDVRDPPTPSARRQRIISRCRSVGDLRAAAKQRLPRAIFDFMEGGAEDERTLTANVEAYRDWWFRPRTLTDVSAPDLSATVLGTPAKLPLIAGPTGVSGFLWPKGDLAAMAAAQAAGIPYCLSTSASVSIEEMAARSGGRLWFQCYIFKQRDFSNRLIERAERAGCEALMITVDFPVGGNRERDFRNDFSVPFKYTARNLTDFACHPTWALSILRHGTPPLANLTGFTASNDVRKVASSVGRNYDASFSWDDLKVIRDRWPHKLIVKGIARPEEAERLAALGCDAIVVSNHGGRQLDGALPTLACLPDVASAVGGKTDVYVDGGIRRGSEIVKALALGAKAVLVGRAMLYGIAAGGVAGAKRTLTILEEEFRRVLQLCGATSAAAVPSDIVSQYPRSAHG